MVETIPRRCIVLDGSSESVLVSSNGIRTVSVAFARLLVLFFGCFASSANAGIKGTSFRALAIDPLDPATVYAGTGGGVFKSTDGGANWQAVNTGLADLQIRALAIDPLNPATVYVGTQGGGAFKITFMGKKLIK